MRVKLRIMNGERVFSVVLRRLSLVFLILFAGYGVLASIFPYFLKLPLIAGKSDVFRHVFISFGVLVLFHYSFPGVKLWLVLVFGSLFAFLLEVGQPFLTDNVRDFQWHDVVSNVIGFGLAFLLLTVKEALLKRRDALN